MQRRKNSIVNEQERDHRDHRDHGDADDAAPIERFWQLPGSTRQWLEGLRPDDIEELKDALKLYRTVNAGGRLVKWLSITIVAIFVGAATLGEALAKLWAFISHAVRQ